MKKMDNTATGSWTLDNNPTSSAVKNSCHPNLKVPSSPVAKPYLICYSFWIHNTLVTESMAWIKLCCLPVKLVLELLCYHVLCRDSTKLPIPSQYFHNYYNISHRMCCRFFLFCVQLSEREKALKYSFTGQWVQRYIPENMYNMKYSAWPRVCHWTGLEGSTRIALQLQAWHVRERVHMLVNVPSCVSTSKSYRWRHCTA